MCVDWLYLDADVPVLATELYVSLVVGIDLFLPVNAEAAMLCVLQSSGQSSLKKFLGHAYAE